jgi:hypothetical protein
MTCGGWAQRTRNTRSAPLLLSVPAAPWTRCAERARARTWRVCCVRAAPSVHPFWPRSCQRKRARKESRGRGRCCCCCRALLRRAAPPPRSPACAAPWPAAAATKTPSEESCAQMTPRMTRSRLRLLRPLPRASCSSASTAPRASCAPWTGTSWCATRTHALARRTRTHFLSSAALFAESVVSLSCVCVRVCVVRAPSGAHLLHCGGALRRGPAAHQLAFQRAPTHPRHTLAQNTHAHTACPSAAPQRRSHSADARTASLPSLA